ncbi:MAG TPA: serine hydrolase [Vicinamibacterales bacterium]|nr:serine hydrolase [Vicinamibacterales bacterium]
MTSLRRPIGLAILCASVLVPGPAYPQPSRASGSADVPDVTLQHLMDAQARRHRGKVSLYARHLRTGRTVAIDPDVPVNTASVIKLAIMLEAMYQVKEGRVAFADVLPFRKDDQVSGSGVLLLFRTPAAVDLETAIVLMIAQSDNTATNLVLARIGRENVNRRLRGLGFEQTTSIRPVGRPKEGDQTPELKPFGIGRTTAREMAGILESIERCDLGDRHLCARMVDILQHQFWRNAIPHYLEAADTTEVASQVANKTGSLDRVRNDVGIVYTKSGPIVISVFTYENADTSWTPENEAELLIAGMAKTIVDGWAPDGLGSEKQ